MPRILIHELDHTEKGMGSDMGLYFNHTFVKVSVDGIKSPIWAKYGGYSSSKGGHLFTLDGIPCEPVNNAKAYIEWEYPVGWFNTKHTAIYCERQPKRQYLKGISFTQNVKINTAESLAKEHGMLACSDEKLTEIMKTLQSVSKPIINLATLKAMFDSKSFTPYEDAYIMLKAKVAFSRALCPDICMMQHPESKDFVVFCHDFPVAELLTKNKLKMLVPEFKPECMAYFVKEGVSVV